MFDSEKLLSLHIPRIRKLQKGLSKKLSLFSLYRFLSFTLFFVFLIILYLFREYSVFLTLFPSFFFAAFLFFLFQYRKHSEFLSLVDSSLEFSKREKLRAAWDIKSLFRADPMIPEDLVSRHFWKDLDIFGKKGLYSYLDTTITKRGNDSFVKSLLQTEEISLEDLYSRQKQIRELVSKKIFSRKLLRLLNHAAGSAGYSKLHWNISIPTGVFEFISGHKILYYSRHLIVFGLWIGSLVFVLMGLGNLAGSLLFLSLLLYLVGIREKNRVLKNFANYFSKIENLKNFTIFISRFSASSFTLRNNFPLNHSQTKEMFRDMDKILSRLAYRDAPLANFVLNLFFQFDLGSLRKLESFLKKWKDFLPGTLQAVENLDSILPFVCFSLHQPEVQFPEISESYTSIEAQKIAHPLIHRNQRVLNPLDTVKSGSITLITGSNMSGKTTYLRSLGVNVLLALCGSPVLAEGLKIPPLRLLSSIKNEDSLDDGISFFYAEVRKISFILKTAKNSNIPCLILIDEVLKGTNTRERIIATDKILQTLSTYNSFSFVTTHDLDLAKGKKAKSWKMKHFVELISDGKMSFDYKIRDGVVTSSNALKILSIEYPEIVFVDD